jgi:ketosteroid isomerase-like protein
LAAANAARDANTAFYTAIEGGDLDALERLWLDGPTSASVCCIHPGNPPLYGRRAVLRSFAALMAATPYIQFILTDVHVTIAGETAVVTCEENILTGAGDSGDADLGGLGGGQKVLATNVFRRRPQGWRLWLHHASPLVDPRRTEVADD